MTISEMLVVINDEMGKPLVKDGGKRILASPYKFFCKGDKYVISCNVENIGMVEVLRTKDEDLKCDKFLKGPKSL